MNTPSVKSYLFVLANGAVAKNGEFAIAGSNGQVTAASVATGLKVVGLFCNQFDVTGDGSTKVEVDTSSDYAWAANDDDDTVGASDLFGPVYIKDGHTVSNDGSGTSVAGTAVALDTVKGVLVKIARIAFSPDGDLVAANNLSDVGSASAARANIGANKGAYTFEKISSKAADAEVARIVASRAGTISKFYTVLNAVLATADATVQLKINGSNVGSTTTGLVTITQSGSAAGDVDSATPLTTNLTFAAGDVISLTVGGGSTATGTFNASIEFTY